MDASEFQRIEAAVNHALDLDPQAQKDYLRDLKASDPDLYAHVQPMLSVATTHLNAFDQPLIEAEPVDTLPQPGDKLGPYTLLRELGKGGMGVVYLAEQQIFGDRRQIALKIMRHAWQRLTNMDQFNQEISILAQISHPNIAKLYDGGVTESGMPYYALEYIEGQTLNVYCRNHAPKLEDRLNLFSKICSAVTAAHNNLIVHADLKPANIMVDRQGEPKLLDFGIAKIIEQDAEADSAQLISRHLTLAYASPQQINQEPVTTACDTFALGLIFYEMLTGLRARKIDPQASLAELMACIYSEPLPPITAIEESRDQLNDPHVLHWYRQLDGDLNHIILKAISIEPQQRYRSVQALQDDVTRFLQGRPVSAANNHLLYRAKKFAKRQPLLAGLIAFAALALLTGMITIYRLESSAQEQRQRAQKQRDQAVSELRTHRNIENILFHLLRGADPKSGGTSSTPVYMALDQTVTNTRADLYDLSQPLHHSLLEIAQLYLDFDQPLRAQSLLAEIPPEIPLITQTELAYKQANLYAQQKQFTEAITSYHKALDHMHAINPSIYQTRLQALIQLELTKAYLHTQQLERALSVCRILMSERGRAYPEKHRFYLHVQLIMADIVSKQGYETEASKQEKALLVQARNQYPNDLPLHIELNQHIGLRYLDQKKLRKAYTYFKQAHQLALETWGEDSTRTQALAAPITYILSLQQDR